MQQAGQSLQLVCTNRPFDHWPVQVAIELRDLKSQEPAKQERSGNQDAVYRCLMEGYSRRELFQDVNQGLVDRAKDIESVEWENTPDQLKYICMDVVPTAVEGNLAGGQET